MRLYPQEPRRLRATVARDALFVTLLVLFALLGLRVHDAVDRLAVLGEGVATAGNSVRDGLDSAADDIDDVPLAGGPLADGLRGAGEATGGRVGDLGERGESAAHDLANLLGVVMFGLPATLVALWYLPRRGAQARRLTDASRAIGATRGPEEERLLAMRAAFSLPYGQLLRYTADPFGDLAAGRHDALLAAALEDAGLRARPTS